MYTIYYLMAVPSIYYCLYNVLCYTIMYYNILLWSTMTQTSLLYKQSLPLTTVRLIARRRSGKLRTFAADSCALRCSLVGMSNLNISVNIDYTICRIDDADILINECPITHSRNKACPAGWTWSTSARGRTRASAGQREETAHVLILLLLLSLLLLLLLLLFFFLFLSLRFRRQGREGSAEHCRSSAAWNPQARMLT